MMMKKFFLAAALIGIPKEAKGLLAAIAVKGPIPRWLSYFLNEETAPIICRFGVNVMGVS